MKYYNIEPSMPLKPYVRFFWVLEHELGPGEQSYIYRSIADSCVEIVFHYQGSFDEIITEGQAHNWQSVINFQSNHYSRFETKQSFGIFGAYLYPFAVPYFFKVPSDETSNEVLDLGNFLGRDGSELEEKIMIAPDNRKRVEILTAYLEARLNNQPLPDNNIIASIKHVIHSKEPGSVIQLADKFNLSVRQFDRKFKQYAGFSPKTYLRLTRLHNAIQRSGTNKSLTQLALECGYYDQSHFVHDLKMFTGYKPSFYFSGNAEGTEYRFT